MPALPVDLTQRLHDAREVVRDLRGVLAQPDEVFARARLIGRKLPSIVQGLRYIAKSDKEEALSIATFLEKNARERPDGTALLYEDRRVTHRELDAQAARVAGYLASRGLGKGDAVAIFVENRPELLFAVAGAVRLGAIAAVINTRQRRNVLRHSFALCGARHFVVGEELWDAFAEVRGELGDAGADRVLWLPDDGGGPAPADAVDATVALAAAPDGPTAAEAGVRLGDPCFYIYTSGTTGLPKASIMSHFRWVKAAGAFGLSALDLGADEVLYCPLPFYHNNALTVSWAAAAVSGAALAMRRRFSATHFWDDVRRYHATAFCYIGELCRYLMNQPARPDDADNPVRRIVGNGLRPDIWKAFKQRFGIDEVYEFYAASEGNIAFVNLLNLDCTVGLCPAPYALVRYDIERDEPVRAADGHLQRVGRGEVGLLIAEVSDKYAFDGYTDRTATEKKLLRDVFRPGDVWFNSGDLLRDLGFRHAQFVDRVGDTFRWRGENVSTNEVAEVLATFPAIAEATVYGVQVPGTEGRAGMAALVLRDGGELDFAALAEHVCSQLPGYAVPVFLRVRRELEVTSTFKQMKGELRKDGYDPSRTGEPVYVMLPHTGRYAPLDAEVLARIEAGTAGF
jgi:citronellyl-CoA synthetase